MRIVNITEIDMFIAENIIGSKKVLGLSLKKQGTGGDLDVSINIVDHNFAEDEIDFELSPSEYSVPDFYDKDDLLNKTIYTSSAQELFEMLLDSYNFIQCFIEFFENTWKVEINKLSS